VPSFLAKELGKDSAKGSVSLTSPASVSSKPVNDSTPATTPAVPPPLPPVPPPPLDSPVRQTVEKDERNRSSSGPSSVPPPLPVKMDGTRPRAESEEEHTPPVPPTAPPVPSLPSFPSTSDSKSSKPKFSSNFDSFGDEATSASLKDSSFDAFENDQQQKEKSVKPPAKPQRTSITRTSPPPDPFAASVPPPPPPPFPSAPISSSSPLIINPFAPESSNKRVSVTDPFSSKSASSNNNSQPDSFGFSLSSTSAASFGSVPGVPPPTVASNTSSRSFLPSSSASSVAPPVKSPFASSTKDSFTMPVIPSVPSKATPSTHLESSTFSPSQQPPQPLSSVKSPLPEIPKVPQRKSVTEPVIPELKAPPPQLPDDDPFNIVTNKPPPQIPSPAVPSNPFGATRAPLSSKAVEEKPKTSTATGGDPFASFDVVLHPPKKPEEIAAEKKSKDPSASIPLKDLLAAKKMTPLTPAFVTPTAPPPAAPTSTSKVPPVSPFATTTGRSVDSIVIPTVPGKSSSSSSQPAFDNKKNDFFSPSNTASNESSSDPFNPSFSVNDDPFGQTAPVKPAPPAPAPVVDDFDIFDKPATTKQQQHHLSAPGGKASLAPPPSFLASTGANTVPKPATKRPSGTSSATGDVDFFNDDFTNDFSKPTNKQQQQQQQPQGKKETIHDSTFNDLDPFSSNPDEEAGDVDPFSQPNTDPFANNAFSPGHPSSSAPAVDHDEMLEKFKLMYNVKGDGDNDSDGSDEERHKKQSKGKGGSKNVFDDEFDDDAFGESPSSNEQSGQNSTTSGRNLGKMIVEGKNTELLDGEIFYRLSTR
jgi:hypothetical protein